MDILDKVSHNQALQNLNSVIDSLFLDCTDLQESHNNQWLALGYIPNETCLLLEETGQEASSLFGVKLLSEEHLLYNLAALDKHILVLLFANRENELLIKTIKAIRSWIGLAEASRSLFSLITDDHFVTRLSFKNFKIFQERRS